MVIYFFVRTHRLIVTVQQVQHPWIPTMYFPLLPKKNLNYMYMLTIWVLDLHSRNMAHFWDRFPITVQPMFSMVHLVKFFISVFKHANNTATCVGTGSFLMITVLILSVFLTFVQLHLRAMSEVKTFKPFGLYKLRKEVPQIRWMIIAGDIVYNGKRVTLFVAVLSVHVVVCLLSYFSFRFWLP